MKRPDKDRFDHVVPRRSGGVSKDPTSPPLEFSIKTDGRIKVNYISPVEGRPKTVDYVIPVEKEPKVDHVIPRKVDYNEQDEMFYDGGWGTLRCSRDFLGTS